MLMEEDYDLLSIDVRTPVMNGKQLYEYIKDRCPKLINRVVFTTGDVISSETQIFIEQGSWPLLPKPFTLDKLIMRCWQCPHRTESSFPVSTGSLARSSPQGLALYT